MRPSDRIAFASRGMRRSPRIDAPTTTEKPAVLFPVAASTNPNRYGPTNPPISPMALMSASPAAAWIIPSANIL